MCDTARPLAGISRRSFVQVALSMSGAAVASTALSGCTEDGHVAEAEPVGSSSSAADFRTRLVLLGTAAGRTWWGGSERKGISTAVVVEDSVYLVDFGEGWARRYLQAGLGRQEEFHGLERLEAAFVTHLHSDHIVDYPNILTFGSSDGLASRPTPLQVFGPGARPSLVPLGISSAPEPARSECVESDSGTAQYHRIPLPGIRERSERQYARQPQARPALADRRSRYRTSGRHHRRSEHRCGTAHVTVPCVPGRTGASHGHAGRPRTGVSCLCLPLRYRRRIGRSVRRYERM